MYDITISIALKDLGYERKKFKKLFPSRDSNPGRRSENPIY